MEPVEELDTRSAEVIVGDGGLSRDPRYSEESADDRPNVLLRRRPLLRLEVGLCDEEEVSVPNCLINH